jgi:hypothetical protein
MHGRNHNRVKDGSFPSFFVSRPLHPSPSRPPLQVGLTLYLGILQYYGSKKSAPIEEIVLPSESSHEVTDKVATIVQEVNLRHEEDAQDRHCQMSRVVRVELLVMSQ